MHLSINTRKFNVFENEFNDAFNPIKIMNTEEYFLGYVAIGK